MQSIDDIIIKNKLVYNFSTYISLKLNFFSKRISLEYISSTKGNFHIDNNGCELLFIIKTNCSFESKNLYVDISDL